MKGMSTRACVCLVFALGSLEAAAAPGEAHPAGAERHLVAVGEGAHWLLIDVATKGVQRVPFPADVTRVEDVAVAPDGRYVVYTAHDASAGNSLLFHLELQPGARPLPIGEAHGYHADPAFSADGAWVYFAHHPTAGGPMGAHEPGAYGQVYRVHPDGSGLERLTEEAGCHFGTAAPWHSAGERPKASVYFVHAHCGTRWRSLVAFNPVTRTSRLFGPFPFPVDELSATPDGKSVLLAVRGVDTYDVQSLSLETGRLRLLERFGRDGPRVRPRAVGRDAFFYLREGQVWVFDGRRSHLFASLKEAS